MPKAFPQRELSWLLRLGQAVQQRLTSPTSAYPLDLLTLTLWSLKEGHQRSEENKRGRGESGGKISVVPGMKQNNTKPIIETKMPNVEEFEYNVTQKRMKKTSKG